MAGCCKGPGWATPMDAFKSGKRETLLYVCCTNKGAEGEAAKRPDYIATVDADPDSATYGQVISRCIMPYAEDEVHHSGWNSCSSCFSDATESRRFLVCPAVNNSRINILDVSDEREPKYFKTVEPEVMHSTGLANPHSVHCLGSKEVMISSIGDKDGGAKGGFLLLDNKDFSLKGTWSEETTPFGYDFWYQPRHNVMISSGWGTPKYFVGGLDNKHIEEGKYNSSVHFWDFTERKLIQSIDLGPAGYFPLEVRFYHEPTRCQAFVACCITGNIFHLYKDEESGKWQSHLAIAVAGLEVSGWSDSKMGACVTDILISMHDKFMFVTCWMTGEVQCYDIQDPMKPQLVSKVRIGGIPSLHPEIKVLTPDVDPYEPTILSGKSIEGGPQMIQLSLDGRRLYVTTSLYSAYDRQFYPKLAEVGGDVMLVDVDPETGSMTLNTTFHTDFGKEPNGPVAAHELRYPGGDCSSDIWL